MKTLYFRSTMTSGLIFLAGCLTVIAQEKPAERTFEKEFATGENTSLVVDNKYGNVNIMNHNEKNISIGVIIRVNVRDENRAEEIFNNIEINLYQEGDVVHAETEITEDFSRIFRGNMGNGSVEIDYSIYMPAYIPVSLLNKYGNVFIDELTSTSTIEVQYGKLNANRIMHDSKEPLTKLILAYSDGVIQESSWLNADIKYAKLSITTSKALVLLSKYSKVFVTSGTSIVSESKYDSFEIGDLKNFVITTAYSNVKIEKLSGRLQAETKYTDVNIDVMAPAFESIKISTSYGNYRIGLSPEASYRLDGFAKYSDIVYPQGNSRVSRINENNELQVKGIVGPNQNTRSAVTISASYGNVRLVL